MKGSYLGPEFSQEQIERDLSSAGARYERHPQEELVETVARLLADGQAVGWFQGRMEFGPRALGNRSILADPRSPTMQRDLNLKVKYRESFRPFAPSILEEDLNGWFDLDVRSPYMLLVASVQKPHLRNRCDRDRELSGIDRINAVRSDIPAVTHVDGTARVQTVHAASNPLYHRLISRFKAMTGCPMLLNTSLNVRGEPIVCTPIEAFRCLMATELDALVVGNCLLDRSKQDPALRQSQVFMLD
jgi:carbamoyltransferase